MYRDRGAGRWNRLVVVALLLLTALVTGADWPTYLNNAQRTANQSETILNRGNAGQLVKLWSFQTQGIIAASAAVVSGTVYFGSWDGYE